MGIRRIDTYLFLPKDKVSLEEGSNLSLTGGNSNDYWGTEGN